MPASNINSINLDGGGLEIIGEITDLPDYELMLLHVWLAQPGTPGAGLAIDCVNGAPAAVLDKDKFRLTVAPAGSGNLGVFGTFVEGPATASAIAFLVPKQPNPRGLVTEVLEWSRIITLSDSQKHVNVGTTPEGQGKSA
jgi:hypothetical protein